MFHVVLVTPHVLAPAIGFVDHALTSAVDLLHAMREGHLVRVGTVRGGGLGWSEEAWSTFRGVPVSHAAGAPVYNTVL